MSDTAKPVWHLILMLIWYGVLLVGSGGIALLGLAFGSEVHRDRGIPVIELVFVFGPLVAVAAFLAATVYCWSTGRPLGAYLLCGSSVAVLFGMFFLFSGGLVV